jgi:nucleoside-diphosphate-sugar epimerase
MTVLVTGATGFLGSHVTGLLLDRGERPRVLVRPGDSARPLADAVADVRFADIGDRSAIRAALTGVDRVVHCAARTGTWGPEAEFRRTNVHGLEILVRSALDAGVQRIVHVSSITVHGIDVRGTADENAPLRDSPNPYSRSKIAGERLLQRMIAAEGAPVTIVRPGWIYGPGDAASFARVARMIEKGRMAMVGSGENHLPLIYVDDVAQGILLASEAGHAEGRSYLLVNDEPVTQRDFLAAIAAELEVAVPTRRIPYEPTVMLGAVSENLGRLARRRQPPPLMRYGIRLLGGENRFIISRARQELGFGPLVDLADGVRRSVMWYRAAYGHAMKAEVRA